MCINKLSVTNFSQVKIAGLQCDKFDSVVARNILLKIQKKEGIIYFGMQVEELIYIHHHQILIFDYDLTIWLHRNIGNI